MYSALRRKSGRRLARVPALGGWELDLGQGPQWNGRILGPRSHSSGRLSDRPWIVIVVVVDDARAMTLGTGDDVAVLILDSAPAMALRTGFHDALSLPNRHHIDILRREWRNAKPRPANPSNSIAHFSPLGR
jgi:hypothetical protein